MRKGALEILSLLLLLLLLLHLDHPFCLCPVPRAVDPEDIIVQSSNQDPHSLLIKFPLEYGRDLNYKDGRPGRYAIGVVQDDSSCETQCSKMMSGIGKLC